MADDKKKISPEVETPTEAPTPDKSGPEPVLTCEEAAILEQEGRAALFEMGELVLDKLESIVHCRRTIQTGQTISTEQMNPPFGVSWCD